MRSIDHLVLPVTTLTLARSRLAALGFTVAPDARHPFGTGNCCVFFNNRTYLEPITVIDRAGADVAAAEGNVFVRRLKRFTERHGEGFAMLAMRTGQAETDAASLAEAGFDGGTFAFKRMATGADGTEREVGVKLAFAESQLAPDATFFTCQHLDREALFDPTHLQHPNGAAGVAVAIAVADDPAEFNGLAEAATRDAEGTAADGSESAPDGRTVEILTPDAYRERYGLPPPESRRGLRFAAFDVTVADLDRVAGFAAPSGVRVADRLVVPPMPGLGAVIAFVGGDAGG